MVVLCNLVLNLFHSLFLPQFYNLVTAVEITLQFCQMWYKQRTILISCISLSQMLLTFKT